MKLRHEVTLRQQVRLHLSQDLTRAIGLLELSNLDMAQSLNEAAQDNPWLRLRLPRALPDTMPETIAEGPSLLAHVEAQIPRLVAPADRKIALALSEALDPAGFLDTPPEAIAARLGLAPARVERVLGALQRIEPRGLFARSVAECLRLQLAAEGPIPPTMQRVLDALPLLAEGGPEAIVAATGLSAGAVETALTRLRALDPRPAAGFATDAVPPRVADLIFAETEGSWRATLNPESLPVLTLEEAAAPGRGTRLARDRSAALGLIRAVERRNRTLLALGTLLAREQAAFLRQGEAGLRVLTMRSAAASLGLHESSVSRIAGSASAATPQGTTSLRAFFARAVRQSEGARAAPSVRARIAALIGGEDPRAPLSDAEIAERLGQEGIEVSRRVVAKLRHAAGLDNRSTRRRAASRPGEG